MLKIKPGAWIAFEGMDSTGKTTQMNMLSERVVPDTTLFTHQPSGGTQLGKVIYDLTEKHSMDVITRQLLHLAAHAEHARVWMPFLVSGKSVVMDRCWWSTFAYGIAGGTWRYVKMSDWLRMCYMPEGGSRPHHVFLFLEPYADDAHNSPELLTAYRTLETLYSHDTTLVPKGSPDEVARAIDDKLLSLGLASVESF